MAAEPNFDLTEDQQGPPEIPEEVQAATEEEDAPAAQASMPEPEPTPEPEPEQRNRAQERIQQEIERRKALEAKVEAMESRFAQLMERAQPREPEPEIPSFDDDPAANLDARLRQAENAARQAQEQMTASSQAQQQQQQLAAFVHNFHAREQAYASQTPDYWDAVEHLRSSRLQEYQVLGYDEAQARQIVDQEALQIAANSTQAGLDPAAKFYELAGLRGYKRGQNGASAATPDEATRLEQIKAAAESTQSLGSSGETPSNPTLEQLAEMDEDDFDKFTRGDQWKKLWS